jgi:hypothetical protein
LRQPDSSFKNHATALGTGMAAEMLGNGALRSLDPPQHVDGVSRGRRRRRPVGAMLGAWETADKPRRRACCARR